MQITVLPDEKTFDTTAAWRITGQILSKPDSVIGLSTGRTTGNMHRLVASIHRENPFDVENTTLFGLDEVVNVSRDYFGACYAMLKTEIADDLGIKDCNFLMLPTVSDDFDRDCRAFVAELSRRGGVDLLMLGLGENGHLGFNQPGCPFDKEAWVTSMHAELEERMLRETTPLGPLGGVTLGIAGIMRSRRIVLVAKGKNKAEIVKRMFECPISPEVPASVLRLHPNIEFLFDKEAASLINPEALR